MERARELDEIYAAHKTAGTLNQLGLLHGLPVSLKNQSHVKDVDTIKNWSQRHDVESQIGQDLVSQGAVLYCKV